MKNEKFDAKSFLNAKTLSPLEQNKIRGGFATNLDLANDVVRVVRVQQVQVVRVVRVVVIA